MRLQSFDGSLSLHASLPDGATSERVAIGRFAGFQAVAFTGQPDDGDD